MNTSMRRELCKDEWYGGASDDGSSQSWAWNQEAGDACALSCQETVWYTVSTLLLMNFILAPPPPAPTPGIQNQFRSHGGGVCLYVWASTLNVHCSVYILLHKVDPFNDIQ